MNKKILLSLLLVLAVVFSASAVQASEVNDTDLYAADSDVPLQMENDMGSSEISVSNDSSKVSMSNEEVLESENSNVLSSDVNNDDLNVDDVVGASGSSKIDASKTVKSKDITKYYKGSTKYTAKFLDENGKVLANKNVKITVKGVTYTKKTNSNGIASLKINLKPGTYKVIAKNPVTGFELTTTFRILSTISASNIKKVYTDTHRFSAKFYKSNGKVLAKRYVKFKVKGKIYKAKTNSKGIATVSVAFLKKGTHKIISYNVDGLTKKNTVKVYNRVGTSLKTSYYVFYKGQSKTIKVKLLHDLGYAPGGDKLIKIKINGKIYSKKTNSRSVAYLKLPSLKNGVYTVKYKFAGNYFYRASSAVNRVAVISTKTPTLKVKGTTTFGHGANTPLKVGVAAGGVALEDRTVKFKLNGVSYTKTTDKNGVASLPIELDIGKYNVSYSVLKDSKINSKKGSTAITVKERNSTTLTWKSGDSFEDGTATFKVLLKDSNKKAVAGQTIKLTVQSKTYTATTASNGYATFKVTLSAGTPKVSVKFYGSNDYTASSTSKSITVTLSNSVKGLNENNVVTDLSKYLKSSKNCQVGNAKIKAKVNSLIKGLTTEVEKVKAIYNFVRDEISYSFYYNTQHGAAGTLSAGSGNCVDQSHLLVAMLRTAGIAARYVHGTCTFSSGSTYGHVWVQVLIGNTWTVADPTSSRNSLGKVANWNTKSFTYQGSFASLSF